MAAQDKDRRTPKLLPAFLLLLLAEGDKYGGELVAALKDISEPLALDRGAVYRSLHDLEEAGQVSSRWEPGVGTPPRRVYQVTREGWSALSGWDQAIAIRRRNLARFARRYRSLSRPARLRAEEVGMMTAARTASAASRQKEVRP